MSRLLEAIEHQNEAADSLTRACAREGAIADSSAADPMMTLLQRTFRTSGMTPADMLSAVSKLK